jgi:hypothetical protein
MNSSATSKGPRRPWILSPAHAMPGVDRMSPKAYAATHHPTLDPTDVMGYPSSSSRKGMTGTMSPYPERSTRSPTATAKEMKAVEDRRRRKIGGEGWGWATTGWTASSIDTACVEYGEEGVEGFVRRERSVVQPVELPARENHLTAMYGFSCVRR